MRIANKAAVVRAGCIAGIRNRRGARPRRWILCFRSVGRGAPVPWTSAHLRLLRCDSPARRSATQAWLQRETWTVGPVGQRAGGPGGVPAWSGWWRAAWRRSWRWRSWSGLPVPALLLPVRPPPRCRRAGARAAPRAVPTPGRQHHRFGEEWRRAAGVDPAAGGHFTTRDFYQDAKYYNDPRYFRCNSPYALESQRGANGVAFTEDPKLAPVGFLLTGTIRAPRW